MYCTKNQNFEIKSKIYSSNGLIYSPNGLSCVIHILNCKMSLFFLYLNKCIMKVPNPLDFEAFAGNEAIHNAFTKVEILQGNDCIFYEEISNRKRFQKF